MSREDYTGFGKERMGLVVFVLSVVCLNRLSFGGKVGRYE